MIIIVNNRKSRGEQTTKFVYWDNGSQVILRYFSLRLINDIDYRSWRNDEIGNRVWATDTHYYERTIHKSLLEE